MFRSYQNINKKNLIKNKIIKLNFTSSLVQRPLLICFPCALFVLVVVDAVDEDVGFTECEFE